MRKQWILKKSFENIVKKRKTKKQQNSGFGQKTSQNKKTMPKQLNSGFCQKNFIKKRKWETKCVNRGFKQTSFKT